MKNQGKVIVLLLAHPDDEVFLIPYLTEINLKKNKIHVIYLTDGQGFQHKFNCNTRLSESKKFLTTLYKNVNWHFHFLGKELQIPDTELYLNLESAFKELSRLLRSIKPNTFLSLCPEGGHPDHDAVSIFSIILSDQIAGEFLWFSCYRNSKFFPFTIMPHKDNSTDIVNIKINLQRRFKNVYSSMMIPIIFRSQWRTWIGLFPLLLWINVFILEFKIYKLNPVQLVRLRYKTLYQKRMGMSSKLVNKKLFDFISKHGVDPSKKFVQFGEINNE